MTWTSCARSQRLHRQQVRIVDNWCCVRVPIVNDNTCFYEDIRENKKISRIWLSFSYWAQLEFFFFTQEGVENLVTLPIQITLSWPNNAFHLKLKGKCKMMLTSWYLLSIFGIFIKILCSLFCLLPPFNLTPLSLWSFTAPRNHDVICRIRTQDRCVSGPAKKTHSPLLFFPPISTKGVI